MCFISDFFIDLPFKFDHHRSEEPVFNNETKRLPSAGSAFADDVLTPEKA